MASYATGDFVLKQGDTLRLSCTWNNDTGEALGFPEEMRSTFGLFYPVRDRPTWICNDD